MNPVKSFEDLRIWQEARTLVTTIYKSFGKSSPASKDYGFKDQIQRSSVSVMNNISEGYERKGDAEFYRFLSIAKGSCGELRNMLYIAEDLNYIIENDAVTLREASRNISKGIAALMRRIKQDKSDTKIETNS